MLLRVRYGRGSNASLFWVYVIHQDYVSTIDLRWSRLLTPLLHTPPNPNYHLRSEYARGKWRFGSTIPQIALAAVKSVVQTSTKYFAHCTSRSIRMPSSCQWDESHVHCGLRRPFLQGRMRGWKRCEGRYCQSPFIKSTFPPRGVRECETHTRNRFVMIRLGPAVAEQVPNFGRRKVVAWN